MIFYVFSIGPHREHSPTSGSKAMKRSHDMYYEISEDYDDYHDYPSSEENDYDSDSYESDEKDYHLSDNDDFPKGTPKTWTNLNTKIPEPDSAGGSTRNDAPYKVGSGFHVLLTSVCVLLGLIVVISVSYAFYLWRVKTSEYILHEPIKVSLSEVIYLF